MAARHFLDISALDPVTLRQILDNAHAMKAAGKRVPAELKPNGIEDSCLAMIFEKPSTRTRVSFDVAMRQLGGQPLVLNSDDLQLGRGESISDTAKVLSRYVDAIMIRANSHNTVLALAEHGSIPIINGLTDLSHPCQIMADIEAFEDHRGDIKSRTIAWVGDGNNVAVSWMHAAARFDFKLRIGCPLQLKPTQEAIDWAKAENADVTITDDAAAAVKGADCVVTDTWVSMGDKDGPWRKQVLGPYAVDDKLMALADKDAVFMHCLPAYRGNEVSASVIDGPQSIVFDEAENRLHAQKAILAWCLGG